MRCPCCLGPEATMRHELQIMVCPQCHPQLRAVYRAGPHLAVFYSSQYYFHVRVDARPAYTANYHSAVAFFDGVREALRACGLEE